MPGTRSNSKPVLLELPDAERRKLESIASQLSYPDKEFNAFVDRLKPVASEVSSMFAPVSAFLDETIPLKERIGSVKITNLPQSQNEFLPPPNASQLSRIVKPDI